MAISSYIKNIVSNKKDKPNSGEQRHVYSYNDPASVPVYNNYGLASQNQKQGKLVIVLAVVVIVALIAMVVVSVIILTNSNNGTNEVVDTTSLIR